jgi:CBS domain-containing protein/uncharacterized protein (DUF2267 family)
VTATLAPTLARYRTRLILLESTSTAYMAARAMAAADVGLVIITEGQQHIHGLVTDRDLALDVVAAGRDPQTTELREVMTTPVVSLPITAAVQQAVHTMRERACRRVPLTEDGQPVGLVTLDNLLADGLISPEVAREVVHAQLRAHDHRPLRGSREALEAESAALAREARAQQRREARAERTYTKLLRAIEDHALDRGQAELALRIVLRALCRRARYHEARHFVALLPANLAAELSQCPPGPDESVTLGTIEVELQEALGLDRARVGPLLRSIATAVAECISMGEREAFERQLPRCIRQFFDAAPLREAS